MAVDDLAEVSMGFVGGLAGGCAGLIFGHPFDTVKVRQQTCQAKYYGNMLKAVRTTFIHEGLVGFYKGMAFPLISVGILNSIFFGVYDNSLKALCAHRYGDRNARGGYGDIALVAGFAGTVQAVPASTIELVKVKLQAQMNMGTVMSNTSMRYRGPMMSVLSTIHREHGMDGIMRGIGIMAANKVNMRQGMSGAAARAGVPHYNGPMHCLGSIYSRHGVRGCLTGLPGTMGRELQGFSVYMASYVFYCDVITRRQHGGEESNEETSFGVSFIAGGLAGVSSWLLNIPIDVIKNRMQADHLEKPRYSGYVDCIMKSYQEGGMRVFWRGLPITCLRAFPVNAITLAVVSATMHAMQRIVYSKNELKLD